MNTREQNRGAWSIRATNWAGASICIAALTTANWSRAQQTTPAPTAPATAAPEDAAPENSADEPDQTPPAPAAASPTPPSEAADQNPAGVVGSVDQQPHQPTPAASAPAATTATAEPLAAPNDEAGDSSEPEAEAPEESDQKPGKKKKKKGLRVYGRVISGWSYVKQRPLGAQTGNTDDRQNFFLKQARIYVKAGKGKMLSLNISAELADGLEPGYIDQLESYEPEARKIDYLRNAYLDVRLRDELRIRLGQFKRPFSRLELRGAASLPHSNRGLINSFVVEGGRRFGQRNLYWGDRGTGVMVWGRTRDKLLSWYVSGTNPGFDAEGIDAHLRLELRPVPWMRFGAGGAVKNTADLTTVSQERITLGAGNVDMRLEHSGLFLLVDAIAGQNVSDLDSAKPYAGGVAGYLSYDMPMTQKLSLRPSVFGEYSDRNFDTTQSEAVRVAAALNLLVGEKLRILGEVELRRPVGEKTDFNPIKARETYTLMAVAQF